MWVIRLKDANSRKEQFVREDFFEGALISFENEEDAVRLAVLLTQTTQDAFGVACVAQRFSADPRKERVKRIDAARIERMHESLLLSMGTG